MDSECVSMTVERFRTAQERDYEIAFREISKGRKTSHWMWYIFPQLRGLGMSSMSQYYGLDGIEETREYCDDRLLMDRLIAISNELLRHSDRDIEDILGSIDALKLRSCMTLFECVSRDAVFAKVLDTFYDGERDRSTIELLDKGIHLE
jgi:uncharacterized protein (DUF1810 family)